VDGALLMRWFHREFKEVVGNTFLATPEVRGLVHGHLATTFVDLERAQRPGETNDDALFRATDAGGQQVSAALRRVMEQPWQLAQAGRGKELETLLTDFGFCMGKCAANSVEDLVDDYVGSGISRAGGSNAAAWHEVIQGQAHVLRRGAKEWPSHKILLQLAAEHADDSAVTVAAEAWLSGMHCDWAWVMQTNRPKKFQRGPLLVVMEGHTNSVRGAQVLPNGRVLSWSEDDTLRLWSVESGALLAVMKGHGVHVLPDGRLLSWSSDSDDTLLRLWDGLTGAPLNVLEGHTRLVRGAQALPEGLVLSWSLDGMRLWNGKTGLSVAVMKGHTGMLTDVRLLPDGRVLSWCGSNWKHSWKKGIQKSKDRTLRLWDGRTGASLAVMKGHKDVVTGAKILADGRVLSWSLDKTLRIWSGSTGSVLQGHSAEVTGAEQLADGRLLSWSKDRTLRLWDIKNCVQLAVMEGHSHSITGATVMPDGRVLSWSKDRTLRIWGAKMGEPLATMGKPLVFGFWNEDDSVAGNGTSEDSSAGLAPTGHNSEIDGVLILNDGRVLSWSVDGAFRLWDGQSGMLLVAMEGHPGRISGVNMMSDGRMLSWAEDGTLRLWDITNGRLLRMMEGHTDRVDGAQVLPDGRVLSWSADHTLRLWDCDADLSLAQEVRSAGVIFNAHVLSNGRVLSWSDQVSTDFGFEGLRLWDGNTGDEIGLMNGHSDRLFEVRVLADGRVLSWSQDETLRVWDARDVKTSVFIDWVDRFIEGLELLPDGRVLSWSMDATLRVWDTCSGAQLAIMRGHESGVAGARVLPDGRVLSWCNGQVRPDGSVSGAGDFDLGLWDGLTGVLLEVMEGHTMPVKGAEVLADGRLLSWSYDCTLRLWDGLSGSPLSVLKGHTRAVRGAQALPDGRLLSWSDDCTLRLWDSESGIPLAVMDGHLPRVIGAHSLPDRRVLFWSDDSSLCLWDGQSRSSQGIIHHPWVWKLDFPVPWGDLDVPVAGARRFGEIWAQQIETQVAFASRCGRWRAFWHGSTTGLFGQVGGHYVCAAGRDLVLLQIMFGAQPLLGDEFSNAGRLST
jgi:WD40 repeat protein